MTMVFNTRFRCGGQIIYRIASGSFLNDIYLLTIGRVGALALNLPTYLSLTLFPEIGVSCLNRKGNQPISLPPDTQGCIMSFLG